MKKETKEKRIFKNLLRTAEEYLKGKQCTPLSLNDLMKKLNLAEGHKDVFKQVLNTLVQQGVCRYFQGKYHPREEEQETITGIIKVHPRGFGFVTPDSPSLYDQDIFVPKHLTQNAVDGDRVEVKVNPFSRSEKGPEGEVRTILERGRTHLAGIVLKTRSHQEYLAYVPILGEGHPVWVVETKETLHVGDRVILEVIQWGNAGKETQTHLSHIIGSITDPSKDIEAAVEEFDLQKEFPEAVLKEAKKFSKVFQKDYADREDFRNLECFTIDPLTAKDFDDALTLSRDSGGNYFLGVHIADVSHYVKGESALDSEAKKRGNSTYFPGACLPMLPPSLSENLCSLRPKVNRLTASVMMHLDSSGELLNYRIVKGVIKSQKRFTYREAKEVLDGKRKSPHAKTLALMVELCGLLKKKRYERGSIEFCIPELRVQVDEQGTPTGTEFIPYDITHQMVEEFMLKANEVVATHLSAHGFDLTYRIHEEPSEESLKDFATLAYAFGFKLPDRPSPHDLQKLFDEALQTPIGPFLATSYIRRMRLALYSPANIGHYGLALTHYCHFTSPIRRYVDLVVHRILFETPMAYEELQNIAEQCSERERISEKAERNVHLLKKLRLLQHSTQKEARKQFEAIVTRVRNFGITFELIDLLVEGFLHVSELEDDYYEFNEKNSVLYGIHEGGTFFAGDKIIVMLKEVDLILLETKWYFVDKKENKE